MGFTEEERKNLSYISDNLKRLRNSHGLTTSEVGNILGLSRQGYVNFETLTREISINYLIKLANYYDVTLDELVANPHNLRSGKQLKYRTYTFQNNELVLAHSTVISTINEDIICVRHDNLNIEFFWRTQAYQKNERMLFEFYDKPYISKVYFHDSGGGFFFINEEPFFFTKAQVSNLVFIGVNFSSLSKLYHLDNFF